MNVTEHAAKVQYLEAALIEGEPSGEPQSFDFEEFKVRMSAEYAQQITHNLEANKP